MPEKKLQKATMMSIKVSDCSEKLCTKTNAFFAEQRVAKMDGRNRLGSLDTHIDRHQRRQGFPLPDMVFGPPTSYPLRGSHNPDRQMAQKVTNYKTYPETSRYLA